MNKNFKFSERIKLEHHLNTGLDCTAIKLAKILNKSRSTIYYELNHFKTIHISKSALFNQAEDKWECPALKKFPFVCNGCANTKCSHRNTYYSAYEADQKAHHLLHHSRVNQNRRSEVIRVLNRSICPLIKDGVSIQVAMNSVNHCDLSESTIRRYIELGLVDAKRKNTDAVKALVTKNAKGTLAEKAVKKIAKIFHENKKWLFKNFGGAKLWGSTLGDRKLEYKNRCIPCGCTCFFYSLSFICLR